MNKLFNNGNSIIGSRLLIRKKFVTWQALILVFLLSTAYMVVHAQVLKGLPPYVIIAVEVLIFLLVWNKAYQITYDLKLLFFFNGGYDAELEFPDTHDYPAITFIIPSYQEPFQVARMTLDSVINIPYKGKKEIIVVDNSKDIHARDFLALQEYVRSLNARYLEEEITAQFIHNPVRETLKPGNLDLAEKHIRHGEYVLILDVDSTLPANGDLLEQCVAAFIADSKLGFLQFTIKATNHHFNKLSQAVAFSQDLHRLRLTCRSYGGYKIFEGHNGMWRKSVLDKVGRWTDYYKGNIMITEDILKSARVYANGYYGKSLHVITGEWVPSSLNALESMWMRWTYGTSQVLFKYFREIYSRYVSPIEKFDISYHILHHFAHGFIFPFAMLLQLFIPGAATNLFLLAVYIIPQTTGAVTIYFRSAQKIPSSIIQRIRYVYTAFFLVDTFTMSTQLKSTINFLAGVPQGWKVTAKGVEKATGWRELLVSKSFHVSMAVGVLFLCLASWGINYHFAPAALIHFALLAFMSLNLLLCIAVFGKEVQQSDNKVETAVIDQQEALVLQELQADVA